MSKATAAITDKFKNTYVLLNSSGYTSRDVQKAYFALGFRWIDGREINEEVGPKGYVRVDSQGRLGYCPFPNRTPMDFGWNSHREITYRELIDAAVKVRAIKRTESKAQKKRAAKRKWDATATPHDLKGMPVPGDTVVAIRLKCGETLTGKAGNYHWGRMEAFAWGQMIASYKVVKPNVHKPQPVKVEKVDVDTMMADIARSLPGQLQGQVVDNKGWIEWNNPSFDINEGIFEKGVMHGPVLYETMIDVKYRDGTIVQNTPCGSGLGAGGAFWLTEGHSADIVAYRLAPTLEVKSLSSIGGDVGTLHTVDLSALEERVIAHMVDTNPKKQYGVASIPLEMWPDLASAYGALGLYNGSLKYGKANYANTPVEASIYIAAARRHLAAWCAGEEFDPADGVPNLGGVLANIAILIEARAAGTLIDDRMLQTGYLKEREALKALVKPLQVLHADKNPKHFTREQ